MRQGKPDTKPFVFRPGFNGFPAWRGMYREADPAALPPNHLHTLINGRIRSMGVSPRSGYTQFNSTAMQSGTACIGWMSDYQISTPKKLWIGTDGCPGISAGAGFSLLNIDPEQDPELQRAVYYATAASGLAMAAFGGQPHIGLDDEIRKVELIRQPYGTEALAASGSSQDIPLATLSAGNIVCMAEFDSKLFLGVNNGAGASFIATWDGVTLLEDDLTSINAPLCMAVHHVPNGGDALYVAIDGELRYRDTDGNWTTVADASFAPREMVPYKDILYAANDDGDVWSWDGSSLALANATTSATDCRALAVFNGYLYYGYETATAAIIGQFDGSTWTDSHKSLTAQFSSTTSIRTLEEYRGNLFAGVVRASLGRIHVSPGTDTSETNTYLEVVPNVTTSGDINFMFVT